MTLNPISFTFQRKFLACDPGEETTGTDSTWQEDKEPVAAMPDCWAQGSVPKTYAPAKSSGFAELQHQTKKIKRQKPIIKATELLA